eukprot:gene7089-biopygen9038
MGSRGNDAAPLFFDVYRAARIRSTSAFVSPREGCKLFERYAIQKHVSVQAKTHRRATRWGAARRCLDLQRAPVAQRLGAEGLALRVRQVVRHDEGPREHGAAERNGRAPRQQHCAHAVDRPRHGEEPRQVRRLQVRWGGGGPPRPRHHDAGVGAGRMCAPESGMLASFSPWNRARWEFRAVRECRGNEPSSDGCPPSPESQRRKHVVVPKPCCGTT